MAVFRSFDGVISSDVEQDVINYEASYDLRVKVKGVVASNSQPNSEDELIDLIMELITFYKYNLLEYFDKSEFISGVGDRESVLRKPRNVIEE